MVEEFWGTMSIYDHRHPMFIRSLLLFDRIVVPIPAAPIYDLSGAELDQLQANARFLEAHGAARIYEWDRAVFEEYLVDRMKEALTVGETDLLYDSRLLLQKRADTLRPPEVMEVTAVPVYGARKSFEQAYADITPLQQQQLMLELAQLITVPNANTPLEDIIRLRETRGFEAARVALRDWQFKKFPQEIAPGKSAKQVALAVEEYKRMLADYEEAMSKGTFSKTKTVVTSVLAIASAAFAFAGHPEAIIGFLAGTAPNLFSLKESTAPRWKDLKDKSFAPAAVVFAANRELSE